MDLDYLKKLAQVMKEHDLSELSIQEEGVRVKLCRGPKGLARMLPAFGDSPAGSSSSSGGSDAQAGGAMEGTVTINSPMVGTFYSTPTPDADSFVSVGSNVDDDTTVCIVEAMKVMNEIKAEIKGEIVAVLVKDAEPVQFGTPLFRVRPY